MTRTDEHTIRTLIFGVTGYTGMELVRILSTHPRAVVVGGSSRNWAGKQADDVFAYIPGAKSFPITTMDDLNSFIRENGFSTVHTSLAKSLAWHHYEAVYRRN